MNVTHLIGTNFFGGPERQILEHALRMREHGITPQILSFHEGGKKNELLAHASHNGLECRELAPRGTFHPGAVAELAHVLRNFGSNLLVAHGYKANVIGRLATWSSGLPLLAVSRGWTAESPRIRFYEWLDRLFLRLADGVVGVSEGQRQKILACGVNQDKVRVIHNAIDLESFPGPAPRTIRDELGIPVHGTLVITAGRLSPEKNHAGLVEAAAMVLAKRPDVWFVVFGEGFLRPELEKRIAHAGIGGRFFLPGFRNEVRSHFHEADIFVLPSHTEGLPNVVLEAFACRKPVVATNVGGTPEAVRHERDGFLVPAGDMAGLAAAILRLDSDTDLRKRMGESGFEHVRTSFGFDAQTLSYLNAYSDILRPRARGREIAA